MLTDADRQQLKGVFLEEIDQLEQSLEGLREQAKPVSPDTSLGRLTRMGSLVDQGTAELLLSESEQRLNKLRDRLKQIDAPDYGVCKKCRQAIALERLTAAPDAIFCIECQRSFSAPKR